MHHVESSYVESRPQRPQVSTMPELYLPAMPPLGMLQGLAQWWHHLRHR